VNVAAFNFKPSLALIKDRLFTELNIETDYSANRATEEYDQLFDL